MRLLFFIVGILFLIKFVESRRVFGTTYSELSFPKFSPRPFKINHKFLPKYEYTVFSETTSSAPPPPSLITTSTVTTTTVFPTTTTTRLSTILFPATTTSKVKSTTTSKTPPSTTTTTKPFIPAIPTTTTPSTPSTTTKNADEIPSTRDSNFDWFGAFIVLLITLAAIAFFVVRRKCSSPSGTYKIPKTNLVPKDYYVNFCKIDDEFIEIHARALYGPTYVTSIENQNFEETKDDETCL